MLGRMVREWTEPNSTMPERGRVGDWSARFGTEAVFIFLFLSCISPRQTTSGLSTDMAKPSLKDIYREITLALLDLCGVR